MARPIVLDPSIWLASRYRAGRHRALLGGDFFDVVQTPDRTLHAMVGDVCGHGPDEAALGASLRIAWRALILSGAAADAVLETLQAVLEHERQVPGTFATLCTLEVDSSRRSVRVRRAGHPPPVLIDGASVIPWPVDSGGPPIAAFDYTSWPVATYELPASWSILLYTDGLIEGRVDAGSDRLGEDGLRRLIVDHLDRWPDWRADPDGLLRQLIERATDLNGDELSDDVAMVLVGTEDDRSGPNGGR
jgi:serine phosphatase RsbU (regulator of sigma subunit)